jgi:hypothetical protein
MDKRHKEGDVLATLGHVLDARQRQLLEMRRKAGCATPGEIDVLTSALRLVGGQDGGGYLVAPAPMSEDEWERKYADMRHEPFVTAGGTLRSDEAPADYRADDKPAPPRAERVVRI